MKKHFPYKITPEIDKQIKIVADNLPAIQLLNSKGEPIYEPRSRQVGWEDLSNEDKKRFPKKEYWPRRKGENFDRPKLYLIRWSVPRLENHYTNLYWIYREKGDAGVSEYVDKVNAITVASKKAAETIGNSQEEHGVV